MIRCILLGLISVYRRVFSPVLPPSCRFTPTCSQYAEAAVREYGPWRGLVLSLTRVLRCNPWNAGGADPLPPPRKGNWLCH